MEKLDFLWHWHFLLGVSVGFFALPHLVNFVKKFLKK